MEKKQAEIGPKPQAFGGINEFHKFISGSSKKASNTVEGQQQPQSKTLNSDPQVDKPSTNTTKTCSVKLVDIGPKTTPAKSCSDNNTNSVTSDESSGDSQVETLKRDLPPHSLETSDDSDEPNPKRVRPSLPEVATGRMLLKPKDFIDLKKRTVSSSSLSDSSRLKSNIKPPSSSSSAAAGSGGDHKATMSTASAFDRVEEELGHLFGASSPQKKDINNSSKVTISPVRSSSSSTKEQTDSNKQGLSNSTSSSSSSMSLMSSSATLTTQSSICAPTTSSSSTGSVTITKLSTGSSLSVESKDLKTILSSSGGNRALSVSNNPTSKVGSLENGFKLKKQNVDIVSMSSTNISNKSEQLSPTDSIKCNKCNEEYSTKEARRLHTCNSILDQHYLSVDNTDRSVQNPKTSSSGPTSPLLQSSSLLSSATNDHGQSSGTAGGGGSGAHSSSSPPSSFDSASSRSSSPMMEQWNNSGNKKQPPPSSGGVKLIQEHSEKLIIEGRPKLSVTKVSRLEAAGGNNLDATATLPKGKYSSQSGGGAGSSSSPMVPKLKLMTNNSSNSDSMLSTKKSSSSLDQGEKNINKAARWSTAIDNSYNGKLKIKLQTEKAPDKNSASSFGSRNSDSAPEGGMPFAFAGKPTYSPSRIEPSNGNGTVQTKGMSIYQNSKYKIV